MLQKDKDRLGYAEGTSEEFPKEVREPLLPARKLAAKEAKKLQMDTYMQMYKSGNIDKEILQPAKNLAKDATVLDKFGFGKNTMPEELKNKRIDNILKNLNSEPNPIKVNRDLFEFVLNQEMKKITDNREKKAEGELVGGQKKLDKNNDGDITAEDLAMLREGKQEGGMMDEQMDSMMQREEAPVMETQMADMMPEKTEEQIVIEESQIPDEMMENNYIDFLIDEALNEDEEEMLMEELQANPQLSMLFDKVMEVAMEFSGSGPVEGPGTEVSDSIPARLSDGEFVFTAKAVEEIGADRLMSMMKEAEAAADERQGMQEGGVLSETTTTTRRFADPMQEDEEEVMQDEKTIQDMRGTNPRMQ